MSFNAFILDWTMDDFDTLNRSLPARGLCMSRKVSISG